MPSFIDANTTVGPVTLSVDDLARSLEYYQQHIGLAVLEHSAGVATLGVGMRALLRLHEQRGARLVRRATGLYHIALLVPSRGDLAQAIRHFAEHRTTIDGAADHLFSEALYLSDPDGHGIEIYHDRPRSDWHDINGQMPLVSDPLDIDGILAELDETRVWNGLPAGTINGHIHLQVADIAAAERFYTEVLGFERMIRMSSASFVSAGGYHHHIGMNTWAGVGVPPAPANTARLLQYELLLPTAVALDAVLERLRAANIALEQQGEGWAVQDPSSITVVLRVAHPGEADSDV